MLPQVWLRVRWRPSRCAQYERADGAEVIADGSIHIYGALRGRALAGAQGNEKARIFCREFHAELVAVAGHYKVLEDIPKELRGKAVQIWLDHEELKIAALD